MRNPVLRLVRPLIGSLQPKQQKKREKLLKKTLKKRSLWLIQRFQPDPGFRVLSKIVISLPNVGLLKLYVFLVDEAE